MCDVLGLYSIEIKKYVLLPTALDFSIAKKWPIIQIFMLSVLENGCQRIA